MTRSAARPARRLPFVWSLLTALALPAQAPPAGDLAAAVQELVAPQLAEPAAVGFSVAVARRGEVLLAKGYGLAEVEFGNTANAETCFRIGSITKQFTAALTMRLVEQHK